MRIRTLLPAAAVAVQFAAPAFAQQGQAATLEELLRQVETTRSDENQLFQQRRAEYEAAPEGQKTALLQRAEQTRNGLNGTSQRLSDTYSANELRINNLNQQLRAKAAALGLSELFGLARQHANDTSSILQQSLITT
jgi:hypothetical protein